MSDDGPSGPPHQSRGGAGPKAAKQPARSTQPGGGTEPGAATRSGAAGTRIYQGSIRVFSAALLLIGLGVVVLTIAEGGGPLSVGVLMGVAFLGVGAARLWLAVRMSR